jgi:uncharacterized membrane protein YraQ (UPF0718 family)
VTKIHQNFNKNVVSSKDKEIPDSFAWMIGLFILAIVPLFLLVAQPLPLSILPKLQDFITLFLSIILEALPFVVLGTLASVFMALFISQEKILNLLPKNRILSHFWLSMFGVFLPVCECGNVPVARRLLKKGFSVSHATTFLLAAPIVNPITFLTTWTAFSPDSSIAFIRIGAGFFIVNTIGLLLSFKKDQRNFLTGKFASEVNTHEEDHRTSKFFRGIVIFQSEFLLIMKMLCFGALIAAATQSFIPREALLSVGRSDFQSVVVMIFLAFIMSICSTVDAFVAFSYVGSFTIGSLVAFLIFGPLIDIKMLAMMKTMFTTKLLIIITSLVTFFSILVGLAVNFVR